MVLKKVQIALLRKIGEGKLDTGGSGKVGLRYWCEMIAFAKQPQLSSIYSVLVQLSWIFGGVKHCQGVIRVDALP